MDEYIEREAAIAAIMSEPPDAHYPHWYAGKIKYIPAADVATVRHGRWVHDENYESWVDKYICSACNHHALTDGDYRQTLSNYCPNCGCKMDLEE